MYTPPLFAVDDEAELRAFVTRYNFGVLLSTGESGIEATHLPLLWRDAGGPHGEVLGHLARANPQWRGFRSGVPILLIFAGPHGYISPRYYASEVNVPTWNYTAVHLRGEPEIVEDEAGMIEIVRALTEHHEEPRADPWRLDAEHPKLAPLFRAIVCFRIRVTEVEGKYKLNQNKSRADQVAVVRHLSGSPHEDERAVAELMRAGLGPAGE